MRRKYKFTVPAIQASDYAYPGLPAWQASTDTSHKASPDAVALGDGWEHLNIAQIIIFK